MQSAATASTRNNMGNGSWGIFVIIAAVIVIFSIIKAVGENNKKKQQREAEERRKKAAEERKAEPFGGLKQPSKPAPRQIASAKTFLETAVQSGMNKTAAELASQKAANGKKKQTEHAHAPTTGNVKVERAYIESSMGDAGVAKQGCGEHYYERVIKLPDVQSGSDETKADLARMIVVGDAINHPRYKNRAVYGRRD